MALSLANDTKLRALNEGSTSNSTLAVLVFKQHLVEVHFIRIAAMYKDSNNFLHELRCHQGVKPRKLGLGSYREVIAYRDTHIGPLSG